MQYLSDLYQMKITCAKECIASRIKMLSSFIVCRQKFGNLRYQYLKSMINFKLYAKNVLSCMYYAVWINILNLHRISYLTRLFQLQ